MQSHPRKQLVMALINTTVQKCSSLTRVRCRHMNRWTCSDISRGLIHETLPLQQFLSAHPHQTKLVPLLGYNPEFSSEKTVPSYTLNLRYSKVLPEQITVPAPCQGSWQCRHGGYPNRCCNKGQKTLALTFRERKSICTEVFRRKNTFCCVICTMLMRRPRAESRQGIWHQLFSRKANFPASLEMPAGRLFLIFQSCHTWRISESGLPWWAKYIC